MLYMHQAFNELTNYKQEKPINNAGQAPSLSRAAHDILHITNICSNIWRYYYYVHIKMKKAVEVKAVCRVKPLQL